MTDTSDRRNGYRGKHEPRGLFGRMSDAERLGYLIATGLLFAALLFVAASMLPEGS